MSSLCLSPSLETPSQGSEVVGDQPRQKMPLAREGAWGLDFLGHVPRGKRTVVTSYGAPLSFFPWDREYGENMTQGAQEPWFLET